MKTFIGESTTVDDKSDTETATGDAAASEAVENKEEKADDAAAKDTSADKSGESDAGASEDKAAKKPKKSADERIAELTAKRREAERAAATKDTELAELRREIEALKGKKSDEPLKQENTDTTSEIKPPDPNDKKYEYGEFDTQYRKDYDKYLRDTARAEAQQALASERKKDEETRKAEAAAAMQQELGKKIDAALEAGIKEFDDFEEALAAFDKIEGNVAPEVAETILKSENFHRLIHYFGKNVAEAKELVSKSPIEQALHLGRLEAKFSANKAAHAEKPKTTKAPDPLPRSRGTNGQFEADDNTTDFAAFMAKHANKL